MFVPSFYAPHDVCSPATLTATDRASGAIFPWLPSKIIKQFKYLAYHSFNQLTFLELQFSFNLDTCDPHSRRTSLRLKKKKSGHKQILSISSLLPSSSNLTASFPHSGPFSIALEVIVKNVSTGGHLLSCSKYGWREDFIKAYNMLECFRDRI